MARPKAPPKEKKPIVTTKAPAVEELATQIIAESHPSLEKAGIKYGFYGEGKKQKRFGRARAIPETTRTLLERPGVQFEVVISPGHWNRYNEHQRRQGLDEVLCSMSFDGKVARIEKPDFKGYRANILRYGVEGHEELEDAFRNIQLILPEMSAATNALPIPANVDPETGEIKPDEKPAQKPRRPKADGFGASLPERPSVTLSMGDKSATLTPETGKNIDKALKGKRGAKATGPQQPTAGA
jgi:hypothetical protein